MNDGRRARGHRWWWIVLIAVLILSLMAIGLGWRSVHQTGAGLAGKAVVTASSTAGGYSARDIVTSGSAATPGAAWQSKEQTSGAWVELSWAGTHVVNEIVVVRNPLDEPGITSGFFSFGDGSFLQVQLASDARQTVVPITPRTIRRLRFTASSVSPGARSVTIAEILVTEGAGTKLLSSSADPDGNAATEAHVTQSATDDADDPQKLVDGSGAAGVQGAGRAWKVTRPKKSWVQLTWDKSHELSSIELVGSAPAAATLSAATVTFSDGTQLPVGAVLADANRPTIVSFMPRVTSSVRITVDAVSAAGPLVLSEIRAYQRGATPVHVQTQEKSSALVPGGVTCPAETAVSGKSDLVVTCPEAGAVVDGKISFQLALRRGYRSVTATVLRATPSSSKSVPVTTRTDGSGKGDLTVDVSDVSPGPLTVEFKASGLARPTRTVLFQLYRSGVAAGDVPSSSAASGRTLTYAEEFDRPISLSRTGLGADYAAAKPTYDGAQDFGEGIFADPALGFDNVKVVDGQYLKIGVQPRPAGYADPEGYGRTHLGGLLASARQGGSGFSAQYGYFEARMAAPAATGTWPAFWMLPSDNLVAAKPVVAEIDAIELYGHDPRGGCSTTHEYKDGKDGGVAQCGRRFPTVGDAVAWHTYGVSVTPTGITFYIDGRVTATAPQVAGGDAPLFFLVDLALGGGWPVDLHSVQDRADLYVDYIRVYV